MNQPISSQRAGSRLSPLAHSIRALVCASLGASALATEAVFSSGAFSGDADSGVSSTKTYTAIANVIGGNVTVNGVTFIGSGTIEPASLSGAGWALTGVPNQFGSGGNHTVTFGGSVIDDLFDGFQYNGQPGTLTLNGLTIGQTYVATLYNEAWGLGANRTQAVTSSEGASTVYNEDEFEASTLRYTFVATGTTTALNFAPKQGGNTMHFYGVSNEQVFNNSWIGGTTASASAWSAAPPFGVGKSASFGAQGGPTNFDLDVPVTTGHVQFDGANAWTVTGANTLTLQADTGGTSVLSTLTGTHTIAAAVQLNSPVAKFGAGTMRLTGAVTGSGKGITVGAGTLTIESATADLSSVGNIANGGTLAIANAAAQKFDTVISGTGGLTKSGNGTLTLGGYQTYGGPTVINAGTLKLSAINTLSIANPSFQTHDALANGSFGYSPTGASWTFSGAGIALNGSPWFNPTNHDGDAGGFIQGTSISQSINVANTGYYTFTFQGVSRGGGNGPTGLLFQVDGSTVKAFDPAEFSDATWQNYAASVSLTPGAHTIAFVANNLLGGDRSTVIDLVTGATGGRLPSNTAVSLTVSGATLDLSAATQTIGSLVGVAGSSVLNDGSLTTGGSGFSGDFAGGISGAGSFTKAGVGAMTLSGPNTYGGSTTVSGGTLRLTGGTLPTGTALSLTAPGTTFDLNGGSVNAGSLAGVAGSAVTLLSGTLAAGSNNSSTTFAGVISGAGGSFVKNGNGTLTLTSTNGYTGATTINGGGIMAGAAGAIGNGLLTIVTGASTTFDLGASQTVSGLEGGGSVTLSRAISTAFSGDANSGISGAKTYTHLIDINGNGTTTSVNGVSFVSAAGTSGANWSLTGAGVSFNGGGGSGITKLLSDFYYNGNPGTLTLTGFAPGSLNEVRLYNRDFGPAGQRFQTATFNTGSTVDTLSNYDQNGSAGSNYLAYQFRADAGGKITISMSPAVAGNTYHWYGVSAETVANLATSLTLGDAGNHQFDGPISGAGNIVKVGVGTQQLNGVNTYTGTTTITAGTLQLGSGRLPGAITGNGNLIKAGNGTTLTLSGANGYAGGTTINGGTLRSGSDTATGSGQVVIGALGTWDLGFEAPTISGLVGGGNVTRAGVVSTGADGSTAISNLNNYVQALAFNNGALTINGVNFTGTGPSGAGYSLSGVPNPFSGGPTPGGIGGGPAYTSLLQNFYYGGSPGVLTFSGLTAGKAYEAVVFSNQAWGSRVQNATFASGSDSQQLVGTEPGNNGYYSYKFVADGSAASITMAPQNPANTYHWYGAALADLGTSHSALTLGSASDYVFNGNVSGGTSIVKVGAGRQELNGVNTYSGPTAINGGSLQFGSGTLPGAITGIGKLIKSGSGVLTLSSAANNYSGGTDINGGTLKAAAPNASGTGLVTVATNATWDLGLSGHTVAGLSGNGTVVRTGGVITLGADGAAQISAANNYLLKLDFGNNGGATVNGVTFDDVGTSGAGWSLAGAGNPFGEGNLSGIHTGYDQLVDDFYYGGNPGVLTFNNLTIGRTYSAVLYTKVGLWGGREQTATFDEDGAGPVANQVTFDPGNYGHQSYQFVAQTSSLSIAMAPSNPGNTYHWFAATLHETAFAAATLTVGDANNYAFSGVITGSTNLVKQGAGTQTLSGANTYSGFTSINNGVLSISASSNLGDGSVTNTITINGGKLRDTGAGVNLGVNRALTIGASGATIEVTTGASLTVPGAISGPGNTLTKTGDGTLTLTGSQDYATLNANLGVTNLNSALGAGISTLNANSTVNITVGQTLAALNIADGVVVTFGDGLPFAGGADKFGSGAAVVPEPGSIGLLLAGALGLAARRRRV